MTLSTDPSYFNMIANLGSKRFIRVLGSNSSLEAQSLTSSQINPLFSRTKEPFLLTSDIDENSSPSYFNSTSSQMPILTNNDSTQIFSTINHRNLSSFYSQQQNINQDLFNRNIYDNYERIQKVLEEESGFFVSSRPLFQVDRLTEDKVDFQLRDEALNKLRSLHSVFYRLSTEIFCKTSTLLDLFCTRVRVRTKYINLVTAACYYIISDQMQFQIEDSECIRPTPENLIYHLKCGGSKDDLEKMVQIIFHKLKDVQKIGDSSGTHKHFLDAFYKCIVNQNLYNSKYAQNPNVGTLSTTPSILYRKLEMALSSSAVNQYRPRCIALSLLYIESVQNDHSIFPIQTSDIYRLANICKIPRDELKSCTESIVEVLAQNSEFRRQQQGARGSNSSSTSPPLQWTLSRRSLKTHGLLTRAHSLGHKLLKIEEDPKLEREYELEHDICPSDSTYNSNFSQIEKCGAKYKPGTHEEFPELLVVC